MVDPGLLEAKLNTIRLLFVQHVDPFLLDSLDVLVSDEIEPLELVNGSMRVTGKLKESVIHKLHAFDMS